jgi:hypothetical protein
MKTRRTTFTLAAGMLLLTSCSPTGAPGNTTNAGNRTKGTQHTGHGWSHEGVDGPIPGSGQCHLRTSPTGQPLPDPDCTPGETDEAVTQTTMATTVCRRGGYTSSVRPPRAVTTAAKKQIMAAYGIPYSQASRYELDHLIELSAGGSSAAANLWPEPNTFIGGTASSSQFIRNDKDQVEAYLFNALCAGRVSLHQLQREVAADWSTAVSRLGLTAIPVGYTG